MQAELGKLPPPPPPPTRLRIRYRFTVPGFAEPESDDEMSDDDTWRSRLTWAGLHWPRRDVGARRLVRGGLLA